MLVGYCFGSPYALTHYHVYCLMLSMYCFRGVPHLFLPSPYPCISFSKLVAVIKKSLQSCPKYDSLQNASDGLIIIFASCTCTICVVPTGCVGVPRRRHPDLTRLHCQLQGGVEARTHPGPPLIVSDLGLVDLFLHVE